jgi:hypothetical protein
MEAEKWEMVADFLDSISYEKGTQTDAHETFLLLYEYAERLPDSLRGNTTSWDMIVPNRVVLTKWRRGYSVVFYDAFGTREFTDLEHVDLLIRLLERLG